jgi:PhoH-like ATPase
MSDRLKFVIDTSVLLHDVRVVDGLIYAQGINDTKECEILIPIYALEELDLHKEQMTERGQRAREIARKLDRLRQRGRLNIGVTTTHHSTVRVVTTQADLPNRIRDLPHLVYDWLILTCAQEHHAILLTKDSNLRIRADGLGVTALDWVDEPNKPVVTTEVIDQKQSDLSPCYEPTWGLTPRNEEQALALSALLNSSISLVTLTGKAGTGKTLLALAAGLQQVTEDERYQRVLVSRAIFPLGRDIGYLPGTLEEKMEPWLQPIYDNLEFLLRQRDRRQTHRARARADDLLEMGLIEIAPITFIRGRSIPNQYLIIDEAQNLTIHEVKTILTRAGEGTKIILIGDPHQVDHPYLDAENNGLLHVVRKFKAQDCASYINLTRGERSPLAELAADLL